MCAQTSQQVECRAFTRVGSDRCGSPSETASNGDHRRGTDVSRTEALWEAPGRQPFPEERRASRPPNFRSRPSGRFKADEEVLGRASEGPGESEVTRGSGAHDHRRSWSRNAATAPRGPAYR